MRPETHLPSLPRLLLLSAQIFCQQARIRNVLSSLGSAVALPIDARAGSAWLFFYHKHYDLSVEEMVMKAKSRDWLKMEKDEEERQAALAAERQRRAEARDEEMYVFTLRFANTLEQAEAGQRAEDVNEDEWQRLQRITGSPRVATPPSGWEAMRQADRQQHTTTVTTTTSRLLQAVTETLQEFNIDYQIYRPE